MMSALAIACLTGGIILYVTNNRASTNTNLASSSTREYNCSEKNVKTWTNLRRRMASAAKICTSNKNASECSFYNINIGTNNNAWKTALEYCNNRLWNTDDGSWNTGSFSTCTNGSKTRAVECLNTAKEKIEDKYCPGEKPKTNEPCGSGTKWNISEYGSCSNNIKTRVIECQNNGLKIDDSECPWDKPETSIVCEIPSPKIVKDTGRKYRNEFINIRYEFPGLPDVSYRINELEFKITSQNNPKMSSAKLLSYQIVDIDNSTWYYGPERYTAKTEFDRALFDITNTLVPAAQNNLPTVLETSFWNKGGLTGTDISIELIALKYTKNGTTWIEHFSDLVTNYTIVNWIPSLSMASDTSYNKIPSKEIIMWEIRNLANINIYTYDDAIPSINTITLHSESSDIKDMRLENIEIKWYDRIDSKVKTIPNSRCILRWSDIVCDLAWYKPGRSNTFYLFWSIHGTMNIPKWTISISFDDNALNWNSWLQNGTADNRVWTGPISVINRYEAYSSQVMNVYKN